MELKRKSNICRAVSLVLTAVLLLATPLYIIAGTDATVKSYEEQLAGISAHIEEAKNALASIRSEKSKVSDEIRTLDDLLIYYDSLKTITEKQIDAINQNIAEKEANIADLEERIESQEALFYDRMVSEYMEDDVDYIEIVLGAENIVDFFSKLEYVTSVLEQDRKIISRLEENKAALADEKVKLAEAMDTQTQRMDEYENILTESNAIYEQKLGVMDRLEYDEKASLDTYTYYRNLEDQLNKELENYLAELQRKSQSAYVGGTGGWPLQSGVYYYISSPFGWRMLWGFSDFHLGIDLACASGTEIYAYNAGTVLKSEWHDSYGNYVVVDHGGGISTLYAHMTSRAVQAGDYVAAGQLLGYVGMTGSASGYHLHFETRENGSVVDPVGYLVFP